MKTTEDCAEKLQETELLLSEAQEEIKRLQFHLEEAQRNVTRYKISKRKYKTAIKSAMENEDLSTEKRRKSNETKRSEINEADQFEHEPIIQDSIENVEVAPQEDQEQLLENMEDEEPTDVINNINRLITHFSV